ncbi:uncharacterized protein [Montipora foliosa]|uniref:uncharacterized protein n=1 Tax=Montipora foliosa TaxID=591990 RepID=UPI0035F12E61
MADCSRTAVIMARSLAIAHIVVGSLLIIFGVADSVMEISGGEFGFGFIFFGVWIGAWMCVTGGLGIPGSRYERNFSRNCFAGVFMGFSITSAVMGGIIIICYSLVLTWLDDGGRIALIVILLILGILEFAMGIWAAVCLCVMKPCCGPAQGPTVAFSGNTTGQTMALPAGGVQVAFPIQPAGRVLPVQASYMYPSAPMPIGAVGGPTPPQLVVAASPVGAGSPQETGMEVQHGKYIPV